MWQELLKSFCFVLACVLIAAVGTVSAGGDTYTKAELEGAFQERDKAIDFLARAIADTKKELEELKNTCGTKAVANDKTKTP